MRYFEITNKFDYLNMKFKFYSLKYSFICGCILKFLLAPRKSSLIYFIFIIFDISSILNKTIKNNII